MGQREGMEPAYELISNPRVMIMDGAGTLFDPGSMIPVYAFEKAFSNHDLDVPRDVIIKYMGREKKDHIQCILDEKQVKSQLEAKVGLRPTPTSIYEAFREALYPLARTTKQIPGVIEALTRLREVTRDIPEYQGLRVRGMEGTEDQGFQDGVFLAMTTGYDERMADDSLRAIGIELFLNAGVASDSSGVEQGRPAPDMIECVMRDINTSSPQHVEGMRECGATNEEIDAFVNKKRITDYRQVLKVGDTKVDLEAADNCGMPSVLVLSGSIRTEEEAQKVNEELGRKHLVYQSLVEVALDVEKEVIQDKIRLLNGSVRPSTW